MSYTNDNTQRQIKKQIMTYLYIKYASTDSYYSILYYNTILYDTPIVYYNIQYYTII